jgi:hypothetical protein
MNYQLLKQILTSLNHDNNSMIYKLLLQTLRSQDPTHQRHCVSILAHIPNVLDILLEQSAGQLETSAVQVATATYQNKMQNLIQPNTGFHFKGTTACLTQLENFSVTQMGSKIQEIAPNIWTLLGILLDANTSRRQVALRQGMEVDEDVDIELGDIAMGVFGNDDGSDESDALEDGEDKGQDGNELETEDPQSVTDVGSSHETLDDGADGDEDGGEQLPKCHYRKQNRAGRNAALLFIVSLCTR